MPQIPARIGVAREEVIESSGQLGDGLRLLGSCRQVVSFVRVRVEVVELVAVRKGFWIGHVEGGGSFATRSKMAKMAVDNLVAGLRGKRLPSCVNPEVYEKKT